MVEIRLRRALDADLEELVELLRHLFGLEDDFVFEARRQRRGLELLLAETQRSLVLVAGVNHRVVAMVSVQLVISTAEGGLSALFEDLVVLPAYRGMGLGRKLLEEAANWAAGQGASRLQLLADGGNALALSFYAHLGWKTTSLINLRKHF